MSAPYAVKINNPAFERYSFYVLSTLSSDQKKTLTDEERILVEDDTQLKNFCNKQSHAKIELLLQKVGVESVRIFYAKEDPELVDYVIFNTARQFHFPAKRSDIIECMVNNKIFATSDRETIATMMLMSQNSSSGAYQVSLQAKNIIKQAKITRKHFKGVVSNNEILDEAKDALGDFNKLLLQQLTSFDYALQALQLNQHELRILCALYTKPYGSMTMQALSEQAKLEDKQKYIGKHLTALEESGHIVCDRSEAVKKYGRKVYYLLSAKGVQATAKYIQYIFTKTYEK